MSGRNEKILIYIGAALSLVYGASLILLLGFVPPPSPSLDAQQVAALYQVSNVQFRVGVVLCLLSGAFFLPWSAVISAEMMRIEKRIPVLALTQLIAGALGALFFILPAVFWGVAAFSAGRDAQLTLLTHEIGFLTLMTPVGAFPLQVIPIAMVCFMKKEHEAASALPRWLGYASLFIAVTADAGVLSVLFKSGPFAWNGIISFYTALVSFSIYMLLLLGCILRAIRLRSAQDDIELPIAGCS